MNQSFWKTLGLALIVVPTVCLVILVFGLSVASATNEQEPCYTDTIQEQINKETRTVTRDGWTEWSDWPGAGPVWDDGRDRGPAAHNNVKPGKVGYREYRYVVVGERTVPVEIQCPPVTTLPPPETTVPETTVPPWIPPTFPEPTVPETTVAPTVPPTAPVAPVEPSEPSVPPATPEPVPDTSEAPTEATGTLPATGTNNWVLAAIATGLVLVGVALWRSSSREPK